MKIMVTIEVMDGLDPNILAAQLTAPYAFKLILVERESDFSLQGERVKRWAHKATKPKGPTVYEQAKEVGKAWNASGKLSPCVEFDATRLRSLKSRLQSDFFKAHWREAIARLERSDFAVGQNDQQWKANVDWFLRPGNVERVMEGRYDNREKQFDRSRVQLFRDNLKQLRAESDKLREDMKYGATDEQKEKQRALKNDISVCEVKLMQMGEKV